MDAIGHPQMRARSLAVVTILALAPPLVVCAAPDNALLMPINTALPAPGQPVQSKMTARDAAAHPMTRVQGADQRPVDRKKRAGSVGDSSAHRAKADPADLASIDLRSPSFATQTTPMGLGKPLRLTLTQAELQSIIAKNQSDSGAGVHSPFDEITVRAPAELLPVRDPTQEIWGGIGAPVWALLHPTQAWRIFMPIPPK